LGPRLDELSLDYLSSKDERWLAALLAECTRFTGKRLAELRERLAEPLGIPTPKNKLRGAVRVLERLLPEPPPRVPAPRDVRAKLFAAAAIPGTTRERAIAEVADSLGVEAPLVERSLFADLAGERRIGAAPRDLTPSRLLLLVNQALLFGVLKRAVRVRIRAWDRGPSLLRHARKLGLICIASGTPRELLLDVSGPFALFRKTELYGRALASLLPEAARSEHFELLAECVLGRGQELRTLRVVPSDPVFGPREPLAYDSRLETRFVRDFEKLRSPWQVRLEPEAVAVGGTTLVPSFELSAHDQRHRFELVGYWTPQYLRDRLAELTRAGVENYVLCVDEARPCGEGERPTDARIFPYKARLDARKLLELVEAKVRNVT